MIDNDPWFVAKDISDALGYTQTQSLVKLLSSKQSSKLDDGRIVINESGLYKAIFRSNKPAANKFEDWVTSEVLPQIRKTGSYTTNPQQSDLPHMKQVLELSNVALDTAERWGFKGNQALLSADKATKALTGYSPLTLFGQKQLVAEDKHILMTATELGKLQNPKLSPQKVNKLLESLGLQVKIGKNWQSTDAGEKYSMLIDVDKKKGSGAPVQQLRWKSNVAELF